MVRVTRSRLTKAAARRLLAECFAERGYIRRPNKARFDEGSEGYKKGTEVRLVLDTRAELREVRRALRRVGFYPSKMFMKHGRYVQPVYGDEAEEWFRRASARKS